MAPVPTISTCQDCKSSFERRTAYRAKYCPLCRPSHRYKRPKKFFWDDEKDALLRAQYDGRKGCGLMLAKRLGMPRQAINVRARELGVARPRKQRMWTPEEDAVLDTYAGTWSVRKIARALKRTVNSVARRMTLLSISRRVSDGYTRNDLTLCFGVDKRVVDRWIQLRLLRGQRYDGKDAGQWHFTHSDVLAFIRAHSAEVDLKRVDQAWFFDLVFNTLANDRRKRVSEQEVA